MWFLFVAVGQLQRDVGQYPAAGAALSGRVAMLMPSQCDVAAYLSEGDYHTDQV